MDSGIYLSCCHTPCWVVLERWLSWVSLSFSICKVKFYVSSYVTCYCGLLFLLLWLLLFSKFPKPTLGRASKLEGVQIPFLKSNERGWGEGTPLSWHWSCHLLYLAQVSLSDSCVLDFSSILLYQYVWSGKGKVTGVNFHGDLQKGETRGLSHSL